MMPMLPSKKERACCFSTPFSPLSFFTSFYIVYINSLTLVEGCLKGIRLAMPATGVPGATSAGVPTASTRRMPATATGHTRMTAASVAAARTAIAWGSATTTTAVSTVAGTRVPAIRRTAHDRLSHIELWTR
jgi:hypothetical protein